MSTEILKKEVLKFDVERMRYLAMNEEYDNCFDCNSREDFFEIFKQTPEQGFMDCYRYWFQDIADHQVYAKVLDMWGDEIFNLYFVTNPETTEHLRNKMESIVTRIKNGEEIE